jgi:hypothetical protein
MGFAILIPRLLLLLRATYRLLGTCERAIDTIPTEDLLDGIRAAFHLIGDFPDE